MGQSRQKIDESKYHFEFKHEQYSKRVVDSNSFGLKILKQEYPHGIPERLSRKLPPGRKTTCEIFNASEFDTWLNKVRATDRSNAESLKVVRAARPTPIVSAAATCSLFDNFSKKTGVVKSQGKAMQMLWHKLFSPVLPK